MKEKELDWARITHLLRLGIVSAVMVLTGDMLLGWGVMDPSVEGVPAMLSRYLSVPDWRIIASALLGLIFIPVECLCWFAVHRMIEPYSERDAHAYRAGIIGCLAFGGCGVHVPCCMTVYLLKRFYTDNPANYSAEILRWAAWALIPATAIFLVFFILAAVVQIHAFRSGNTPLPRRCWIFSVIFGLIAAVLFRSFGDHALTNALSTGWISIGNLWMSAGLLVEARRVEKSVLG